MYSLYNYAAVKIKYEKCYSLDLPLTDHSKNRRKQPKYTKNLLINIGGRIRAGKLFSFSYDSCDIAMWIIEEEIPQDLKIMDNVL